MSVYELLANEEYVYLTGVVFTFASTLLFASASTFKKRYLGHES
ncbi:putative membrane protein [Vibrio parahaemolyticus 3259]|nr:putative membrane protein [Vibrio parahaemolyticus 3259]ETJ97718.1 putative membrane protein [Vibrio parahaemolyticus EKP-008]